MILVQETTRLVVHKESVDVLLKILHQWRHRSDQMRDREEMWQVREVQETQAQGLEPLERLLSIVKPKWTICA